ncbi:potassium transporter TrkG [Jannaschia ovalis]|uniref:Potassium transporter TrkG n=1 Tax=Jannaschia ovalis TaxID=3038773 RepID=A0ABY8LE50_9RHOB|nr:potassium transporter TrkG [Jannaschia sp. GRR-S6-38]WGH78678.1 potassium transporter TrkG [Jannaschia sp. GRR-S6-38]
MTGLLARVPLLVLLAGILSASMYIPAVHALLRDAHAEARAFFYWGTMLLAIIAAVSVAISRHRSTNVTRSHLVALLATFVALPAVAALPLGEILPATRWINLYVEMVAALTTTGGSLYLPDRLSETAHLWRGLVAWQGGLMIWVAAVAILAPLRLGGFEVTHSADSVSERGLGIMRAADPEVRLMRHAATLVPIYAGLTALLWALLVAAGEAPTPALIHAMSTLATSGISADGSLVAADAGRWGELAIFAFLFFAVSRQTFTADLHPEQVVRLTQDREMRIAVLIVVSVTLALFARHWIGAFGVDAITDIGAALRALWGSAFTVLSFLTTTGFQSADWAATRTWSGLETPAVLLVGLAMFGGGVATTAGGVKLLRIYALYAHGRREMNLLVHPHSIAGGRGAHRHIKSRGIEAAWIFFMLYALTVAAFTLGLTATGLDFGASVIMATAGLSTTGPLAQVAGIDAQGLNGLPDATKAVWAAAMVVGRLETLALIALFNPDFWRN